MKINGMYIIYNDNVLRIKILISQIFPLLI